MTNRLDMITEHLRGEDPDSALKAVRDRRAGRRAFLQGMGVGAAGLATAGLVASATPAAATASVDVQILTFALNLEYLESEFYLRAAFGTGLGVADRGGNPGTVTGGTKVTFQSAVNAAYAVELANEELAHVQFLRAAIAGAGVVPASEPNIDLVNSFNTAAIGAGLAKTSFNPFTGMLDGSFIGDLGFLLASYIFEDVGVTAYHGALTSISNKTYLDKASGIMATEAYHAGIVRTALFAQYPTIAPNATQMISYLRQTLTGAVGTPSQGNDHGVGTTSAPTIFDGDGNAIAWDRTTAQVLNVVYGNTSGGATPGLFFPSGISNPT